MDWQGTLIKVGLIFAPTQRLTSQQYTTNAERGMMQRILVKSHTGAKRLFGRPFGKNRRLILTTNKAGDTMQSTLITLSKLKTLSIALAVSFITIQPGYSALDSDYDGVPDSRDKCPDNARGATVDSNGCYAFVYPTPEQPKPDEGNIVINITFDSGSAVVPTQFISRLRPIANHIKNRTNSQITIHGHTDNSGSAKANLILSKARAKSVAAILVNKYGIPVNNLRAMGHGESRPVASNNTLTGRLQNRRVVIAFED